MRRVVLVGVGAVVVLLALGMNTTENIAESCYVVPEALESWGEVVHTDPQWSWWPPGWGCRYTEPRTGMVHVERPSHLKTLLLAGGVGLAVAGGWRRDR